MGLFFPRCALSGISLEERDVGLAVLIENGGAWSPVALPIWGHYDGYGALEHLVDDGNLRLVERGLSKCHASGSLVVNRAALPAAPPTFENIVDQLSTITRSLAQPRPVVECGGRRLLPAYLSSELVDAVVSGSLTAEWRLSLEPTNTIYPQRLPTDLERADATFRTVHAMVVDLGGWQPAVCGQFDSEEQLRFLQEAERRFGSEPTLVSVIKRIRSEYEDG